jgi:hypothetical protein
MALSALSSYFDLMELHLSKSTPTITLHLILLLFRRTQRRHFGKLSLVEFYLPNKNIRLMHFILL